MPVLFLKLGCIITGNRKNGDPKNHVSRKLLYMKEAEKLLAKSNAISRAIDYMESIDAEKAYENGRKRIAKRRRKQFLNTAVKVAACLAVPLALSTAILGWLHFFPSESGKFASVTVPAGSVVRYELPDNSIVWLNSQSTLKYPVRFSSKSRRVELEGEAYFEVEADPDKPFYVNTSDNLAVRVYGTRFNVTAYNDDPLIRTTLESGHVEVTVSGNGAGTALDLVPGEQATYDKATGRLEKKPVNTYEHIAWTQGRLVFRNASLGDVFKSLERKFGVRINVQGKINDTETYRATFRNESLSQIMDYLSRTAGFGWAFADRAPSVGGVLPENDIIVTLQN